MMVAALASAHVAAQAPGEAPAPRNEAQRARYQMGTMESVLKRAVELAASVTRERLRAAIPARMLLSEDARARGFRLDGWGVFFDVTVPNLEGALTWSYVTLNQNDLGVEAAIRNLRVFVDKAGDPDLRQALDRIELQVQPRQVSAASAETRAVARPGAAPTPGPPAPRAAPVDPILNDPEGTYRAEVINALMDAMLDYSRGLDLASGEWLSIGARRDDPRPGLAGSEAATIQLRINGADLRGFWGGQVSREETRKRMHVQVF
jgi:hypothetical protein